MRMSPVPVLLMASLFVPAMAVLADAPETVVAIKVTNTYEKPVNNATVILDFLGSHQITKLGKRRQVHWEVHTDMKGLAHFPPVPQGTLQLQVVAKNYQTFGQRYDVDGPEKSIEVKLLKPQEQYSAHPPLPPPDPPKPDAPK